MSYVMIDIRELENEILIAQMEVDRWALTTTSETDKIRLHYERFSNAAKDTLDSVRYLLINLRSRGRQLQERLHIEKHKETTMLEKLKSMQVLLNALPKQVDQLNIDMQRKIYEMSHILTHYEIEWKYAEQKLESLWERVALYEQVLGLTFLCGKQNELVLLMNNIDSNDPDRIFMFAVWAGDNKMYRVTKMSPRISEWMEDLVDLNKKPETFYKFVRRMRKHYQKSIS